MKLRVYAVLDKAVQAFNAPLVFRSEGEALRSFYEAVVQNGTQFNKHKRDYAMCFIGIYDDALGSVVSEPPMVVAEAVSVEAMFVNGPDTDNIDYFPRQVS